LCDYFQSKDDDCPTDERQIKVAHSDLEQELQDCVRDYKADLKTTLQDVSNAQLNPHLKQHL
jgi:hypothetical protein